MRKLARMALTIGLVAVPAFALDLNLGARVGVGGDDDGAAASSVRDTWSVQVCRPETEAKRVKIEVGHPKAKNHQPLATWSREAAKGKKVQEYEVPEKFRNNDKLWVQGDADPKDQDVLMAVLYKGRPKRVYSFTDREAHDVSADDADVDFSCGG
jgi:hypothetical protein